MLEPEPIRRTVAVRAQPRRAFDLFTEGMGTWWPLDAYSRAVSEFAGEAVEAVRLEFQAKPGGTILEHLSDGRVVPWAEVTGWEPPRRVVMAWHPHSFPEPPTEVDVVFAPDAQGTRVELAHRGWERVSEGFRDAMYPIYVTGWDMTLPRFVAAADRDP